jgi:hypothetical protein
MTYVVAGKLYTLCGVTLRYTLACWRCTEVNVQDVRLPAGREVPLGTLPPGWQVVEGKPICPQHSVQVS